MGTSRSRAQRGLQARQQVFERLQLLAEQAVLEPLDVGEGAIVLRILQSLRGRTAQVGLQKCYTGTKTALQRRTEHANARTPGTLPSGWAGPCWRVCCVVRRTGRRSMTAMHVLTTRTE